MNFAELSAVLGNPGEFVGSFAMLVTLIYLAVQVRTLRLDGKYMGGFWSMELCKNGGTGVPFTRPISVFF